MANQQYDERAIFNLVFTMGTAAGTDPQQLTGSEQITRRVDSLFVANFDSIPHTVLLGGAGSAGVVPFAVVPLAAAVAGVPSLTEVIQTAFVGQQAYILQPGHDLYSQFVEAVTADATPITISLFGGTV